MTVPNYAPAIIIAVIFAIIVTTLIVLATHNPSHPFIDAILSNDPRKITPEGYAKYVSDVSAKLANMGGNNGLLGSVFPILDKSGIGINSIEELSDAALIKFAIKKKKDESAIRLIDMYNVSIGDAGAPTPLSPQVLETIRNERRLDNVGSIISALLRNPATNVEIKKLAEDFGFDYFLAINRDSPSYSEDALDHTFRFVNASVINVIRDKFPASFVGINDFLGGILFLLKDDGLRDQIVQIRSVIEAPIIA